MDYIRENYTTVPLEDGGAEITAARRGIHRVFWSASPDGFNDDNELPAFELETAVPNPLGGRRCYYHIVSEHGYGVAAARSLVPDGVSNLRDLGGYNTEDMGSFVRYGALYRSDALIYKERRQLALLEELGLRQIVDLRMPEEIVHERGSDIGGAGYINLSPMSAGDMKQSIKSLDDLMALDVEGIRMACGEIFGAYSTMIFGSKAYRAMFRLLVEGRLPLLFHCAAGKDRTGVGAALILLAVGVPRETIIYDYMLTNEIRKAFVERWLESARERCGGRPETVEAAGQFIQVSLGAIGSMFDAIDRRYGDVETFFENELLVTKSDIEKLKNMLLVRHNIEQEKAK